MKHIYNNLEIDSFTAIGYVRKYQFQNTCVFTIQEHGQRMYHVLTSVKKILQPQLQEWDYDTRIKDSQDLQNILNELIRQTGNGLLTFHLGDFEREDMRSILCGAKGMRNMMHHRRMGVNDRHIIQILHMRYRPI
jgi:hypothetical protein